MIENSEKEKLTFKRPNFKKSRLERGKIKLFIVNKYCITKNQSISDFLIIYLIKQLHD